MTVEFDPSSLQKVRMLTLLGYSGVAFLLPPVLAAKFWLKVAEVGEHIIGAAVQAWDEWDQSDDELPVGA